MLCGCGRISDCSPGWCSCSCGGSFSGSSFICRSVREWTGTMARAACSGCRGGLRESVTAEVLHARVPHAVQGWSPTPVGQLNETVCLDIDRGRLPGPDRMRKTPG